MKGIMKVNENNTRHMTMSEKDCKNIADKIPDRLAERER